LISNSPRARHPIVTHPNSLQTGELRNLHPTAFVLARRVLSGSGNRARWFGDTQRLGVAPTETTAKYPNYPVES